jgi:hypothetical protein
LSSRTRTPPRSGLLTSCRTLACSPGSASSACCSSRFWRRCAARTAVGCARSVQRLSCGASTGDWRTGGRPSTQTWRMTGRVASQLRMRRLRRAGSCSRDEYVALEAAPCNARFFRRVEPRPLSPPPSPQRPDPLDPATWRLSACWDSMTLSILTSSRPLIPTSPKATLRPQGLNFIYKLPRYVNPGRVTRRTYYCRAAYLFRPLLACV